MNSVFPAVVSRWVVFGVLVMSQMVVADMSPELKATLSQALSDRGEDYLPRTEHLNNDGSPVYTNRLILEDSPYLLQHAHNPVNWYPWGEEAFKEAKRTNKPVFLSIGYATCHWCHVMERESFENEAIAKLLNDNFIAIKVDREQRPDVDATYMTAVQMLTGSGGWPMSNFLIEDAKPFYGGTYYPPAVFTDVLNQIAALWQKDPDSLLKQAEQLSAAVANSNKMSGDAVVVGTREIDNAMSQILANFDDLQGGFSDAPKFPHEPMLFLLLDQARRTGNGEALNAAHFSLQRMAAGGIHDQVGGGFHRYSVDNDWLVPHFEKMLYNQAALSRNYLHAYLLTGDRQHARTVRRTLDYVLREMTSPEGGFYSATDADSEGEEGTFFVWTPAQLREILHERDAKLAIELWNVTDEGNFESKNILHMTGPIAEVATEHELTPLELTEKLNEISRQLWQARSNRTAPLLDAKIITEWNGMMINAFAEAGDALGEPKYLDAAIRAANRIWQINRQSPGHLWRAHFSGKSSIEASQPDYAYLGEAMLMLFDATQDSLWLERTREVVDAMLRRFWDDDQGGFFLGTVEVGGASLPSRPKDLYDNSTPSGNAVALRVLTHMWYRTGEDRYRQHAEELIAAFSPALAQYPSAFGYLLTAASDLLSGESGSRRYLARGKVRVDAVVNADLLSVQIDIAPGWHINAHEPLQDYLVPTTLTAADNQSLDVQYPAATRKTLGFQQSELALYEGSVALSATMPKLSALDGRSMVPLSLQLQACNDEVCLPPEPITLNLSVASEDRI